jgi:hypothetical protein
MRPASRIGRFALAATIAAAGIAATTPTASASFHLTKIKEITGSAGGNNSFIELQMYEAGQNLVSGHNITVWDGDGLVLGIPQPIETLPLSGPNPANGQSQRTILIGDTGVAGRDFTLELTPYFDTGAGNNLGPAGAACFDSIPVDCVSWGTTFTGANNLPDKTTPIQTALGAGGLSFRRNIGGGTCATALDAADDTNNAAVDFTNGAASPTPNSTLPTETLCTPTPAPSNPASSTKKKCKKKKKKGKSAAAAAKKCKKKKK